MTAEDYYSLSYDMLVMISDNLNTIIQYSMAVLILLCASILYYLFWRRK